MSLFQYMVKVKGEIGVEPFLVSSAPGRADFLNTHQDYKGLPVVPIAVSLRTYVFATRKLEGEFRVISLNLKEENKEYIDTFKLDDVRLEGGKWFGDYFRAVVIAMSKRFKTLEKGLEVTVDSNVPIASGLASSAALEVAFTKLLDEYYGLSLTKKEVAEVSYSAEREVMGIPCGRLDQYGSAYGGAILLYPRPPVRVETLPLKDLNMVIVDTGIRHSVSDIHPRRQEEIDRGLKALLSSERVPVELKRKLGPVHYEVKWESIELEEVRPYLSLLDDVAAKRILFTIMMNESTKEALNLIRKGVVKDLSILGNIVNQQHELLRDLYDVSLPEIEHIRNAMLSAGALGVKISGAGLGGCLIALVKNREEGKNVLNRAMEAGALRGWVVKIDEGVRIEYEGTWPRATN